ncbi:MAG TPA: ABC transporter permease [Candidatus Deferrimicrobiaceae bacterium]|nr:ABC transporter permease [Candidatus Deferrimicrobiaceae bacterium]
MSIFEAAVAWLLDAANWSGPAAIPARLLEHAALSGMALLVAMAMAIPAGIWIGHTGRGLALGASVANVGRALPSLAVIGIVLPITAAIDPQAGFKVYPTLVAMVVLAIPPILVNTQTGLREVDREIVEAARAMGMRPTQVVAGIELPLAVPAIVAGLRSAGVQVVATATLGAIFGGGGLGRYLVEGIAQRDDGMVFGGVVLVAVLALAVERAFVLAEWALRPSGLRASAVSGAASRAS